MIRNIAHFKAQQELDEAEIPPIFADLAAIRTLLPGVIDFRSGCSESPVVIERCSLRGYGSDFTHLAALAAYQDHPDNRRVGAAVVSSAQGGQDGIPVFDLSC